jgi:hypothetical protein
MDWAVLWSRGDRLATKPELVLSYLEFMVEAPGVELDGVKTENINGHAGLHNTCAALDAQRTARLGSLGSGGDRLAPVRNG